jgi:histidinol-phosphate aminotransferase
MRNRLARSVLEQLKPYVPGKPVEEVRREYGLDEIVKMASNENPWGTSPMAMEAMKEEVAQAFQYPEGSCLDLRQSLAERLNLEEEMITVSNGADNVLMMIVQAFIEPGEEVIMACPTFPVYRSSVSLMGGVPVEVPLQAFTHDLEAMNAAMTDRTKAVFICNPNNPTGTVVNSKILEDSLSRLPADVLMVLDEVYGDFASPEVLPDALEWIRQGKRVISVRSFSKLYGLAGLRVGYAAAPSTFIEALNRVREPFPVNRLAQVAALAALKDQAFSEYVIAETRREKDELAQGLGKMGMRCLPSHTNFMFVDLGIDAQAVFEALLKRGIIIRPGGIWGTPTWCRITIGTQEQNRKVVKALEEVVEEFSLKT